MTRKWMILVIAVVVLTFLSPARAQAAGVALEDDLTDNLSSEEDVKLYRFEMEEPGDAILYVSGLQEQWDGYAYHWLCTIYGGDMETVVAQGSVRGFSEATGPNILAAPDLEAGTYYVQMTSVSFANPLVSAFTTDSYNIRFVRAYHSAVAQYDGDGVQTFHNRGDVLWSFDGTAFIKCNDGTCFGALMRTNDGVIVPILIGTDPASVEYMVSDTGQLSDVEGPWHYEYSRTDYYYATCGVVAPYGSHSLDAASLPILYTDTNGAQSAAERVADELLESEVGELEFWWLRNGKTVKGLGGGALALVVLGLLAGLFGTGRTDSDSDGSGSYSGTYTYSDSDYVRFHQLHDDLDAVQHAMKITERYGEEWTGYDPEAWNESLWETPDPEVPTDSSDIW